MRQLERDWEAALAERQRLGEEYDRFAADRPRTLTAAEREQIRALAADLPAVWDAPTTTDADRKQLIRHLVEQVRITVAETSEKVDVEVTWAGGHRTGAQITRPVACLTQLSYYPQLAARARELAGSGCTTAQIAGRHSAGDLLTPKRSFQDDYPTTLERYRSSKTVSTPCQRRNAAPRINRISMATCRPKIPAVRSSKNIRQTIAATPIAEYVMTFSVSISQRSAHCVKGSNRINLPQIGNRKSRKQQDRHDRLVRS